MKKKNVNHNLDTSWSLLVKLRAGMKCEKCGKEKPLNSHHIYSRSKLSTRWHLDNGICLCVGCHTFSSVFSAHKTPIEFVEWLTEYKGKKFINRLRAKSYTMWKPMLCERQELLKELQDKIKSYG